jgi:spermidine synthase
MKKFDARISVAGRQKKHYSTEPSERKKNAMGFFSNWLLGKSARDRQSVYVTERFGVRSLHIGSDTIQSSMRLARPNDLELAYTRSMMAFMLFNERPARVVMIGMGGGSLAKFVYHRLPWAKIDVVEIDPKVVAIARQQFFVPPDDERLRVHIGNGAEWIAREGPSVDVIAVDGYDGDSQVEELSTRDFYEACRKRLAAGGALVANLWGSDRRFHEYLERIETAFPAGTLCLPAEKPGNVIVFGFRDHPGNPDWDALERKGEALQARYGLEFPRFVRGLRKMNRWDERRLYAQP